MGMLIFKLKKAKNNYVTQVLDLRLIYCEHKNKIYSSDEVQFNFVTKLAAVTIQLDANCTSLLKILNISYILLIRLYSFET
jgi:hypothetical protein